MSAIDLAIAAVFADPNIGMDVVYRAGGVGSAVIRAVERAPDEDKGFYDARVKINGIRLDVQVADVAQPTTADLVDIGTKTYKVGEFKAESRRLIWRLTLKES